MPLNPIENAFEPLNDLPCWNVKRGYGSFLTMEFGEPHLKIDELPKTTWSSPIHGKRRRYPHRTVTVRGQWHLWIYCCHWFVMRDGLRIGDSYTDSGIDRAAAELRGQKLISVTVNHLPGRSILTFDLGARLFTRPYSAIRWRVPEQWMLYEPSGRVLSFRADGKYSHHPGNTRPEDEVWLTL